MEKSRILVVDDDESFLILIDHLLRNMDYEIATVSDSTIAYEKIIEFSPDLIISDIQMPSLDGNELLRIIKSSKLTCHIPVMFLSAVSLPDKIRNSLQEGAEDFLTKPVHPNVFRAKVEKALERIKQTRMVQNIISRYLGPDVAKMVIKDPGHVKVYGQRCRITCLFADIRSFSSIVETMEPEEAVSLLNCVLEKLSDAVFSLGGTIDKFLGDGLMAFWGAPLVSQNMEFQAVEAALLMLKNVGNFNAERRYPSGLEIQLGIGISVGDVVVGNIGSEKRTDYTVIGESVNIAARLEKMARPGQILISDKMHENIIDAYRCKMVGEQKIKGLTLPIYVYEVLGKK